MRKTLRMMSVLVLVASGCAGSASVRSAQPGTRAPGASPGSPVEARSPAQPDGCTGIGAVPAAPAITYLAGAKLFQLDAGNSHPQCLAGVTRPLTLSWSNNGDQVLLGGLQTYTPEGERPAVAEQVRSPRWSYPTGRATIHISIDSKRMLKIPAGGGPAKDISFLVRHDEVVYHPAGTHIAVAGVDKQGRLGIFMAVNDGTNPQVLASAEEARSFTSLAFSPDGESLYFVADHGGHWHLHRLDIAQSRLETVAESDSPIAKVTVSPDGGALAWRQGSCTRGTATMTHQGDRTSEVKVPGGGFQEPAGWQGSRVLVLARNNNCDEPGDLVLAGGNNAIVASNVDRAAVRMAAQGPAPPPPVPGAGVA